MIHSRSLLRFRRMLSAGFITAALLLAAACKRDSASQSAARQTTPGEAAQSALMDKGLNLLYQGGDADSAVATFRLVLSQNPTHYGARFQLARALDRAGEPKEARKGWDEVLSNANSSSASHGFPG